MTATSERAGAKPSAHVRLREQVRVAVLYRGRQTDLVLPATEVVATVVSEALRQVIDQAEDLRPRDDQDLINPGKVVLKRVGGSALARGESLREQGVTDGTLLILDVEDAEVSFTPVIENASSAIADINARRFKSVTPQTATTVAAVTAGIGAALVAALLVRVWALAHAAGTYWPLVPPGSCATIAVLLVAGGAIAWWRQNLTVVANGLWAGSLVAAGAAGYTAVPGPAGAWNVVFAAALTGVLAVALWVLGPAPAALLSWLTIVSIGAGLMGLLHAVGVPMIYLWTGALVAALVVLKKVEALSATLARVPMPSFPTVTGKLTFDDADEMASEALVAAETEGTPSVDELSRAQIAANGYVQAIVAAIAPFFVLGAAGAVAPGQGRWMLATGFVLGIALILVFGGRALDDRAAAVTVVGTALAMSAALGVKYALSSHNPTVSLIVAGLVAALGLSALVIAAVVPRRAFSAPVRKGIEWFEYALQAAVWPLLLWLLNIYELVRNWA
ncbi:type VII secretion integral membrane protein EccD [Mycolicibacterium llatzerense]|uniref:type VII secretion integral membrane protein EccD n=1 Tax=Mycolicibacterium llatzerense TaxID=280871 RepID=UPI0021B55744|nr:type VII secretion integral membrane protein EccD [Mycolicibacterium llatzerense]MCT7367334.1 type VII secretion integral membrane protein EccD [Mycolicibacterium llatzerense]